MIHGTGSSGGYEYPALLGVSAAALTLTGIPNQANNSCTAPPAAAANAASPCSPAIMGPRPRDDVIAASGARLPRAAPRQGVR